ncbi:unnamed protein product, partial [Rotaria sp. Silwood1]
MVWPCKSSSTHDPDPDKQKVVQFNYQLKNTAESNQSAPPSKLINQLTTKMKLNDKQIAMILKIQTLSKDGVHNETLYKKENGRQIDPTRRYYLVKEKNLDEFNLYVKITKGRNLGFYRVYNHEQEVMTLIQFGLNQLKNNGQLPIVANYTTFALNKNTGSKDSANIGLQQSSLTAATTRLTPMPDRLRVRTNGNAATSSSSSLSQLVVTIKITMIHLSCM